MIIVKPWVLLTANIYYRLPDHPSLLQEFLWQKVDERPDFPEFQKFLNFWQTRLDGKLHSVRYAWKSVVESDVRFPQFSKTLQ